MTASSLTDCVIRMYLLGTWHPSILEAIRPRGRGWGVSVRVVRPPVWDDLFASQSPLRYLDTREN